MLQLNTIIKINFTCFFYFVENVKLYKWFTYFYWIALISYETSRNTETAVYSKGKKICLKRRGSASGKEPTCQCKRHKRCGFDPWLGRFPGGGHGNPLQYPCLENPIDRGAWWATVHRVTNNYTWLKCLSMHKTLGQNVVLFMKNLVCFVLFKDVRKWTLTII